MSPLRTWREFEALAKANGYTLEQVFSWVHLNTGVKLSPAQVRKYEARNGALPGSTRVLLLLAFQNMNFAALPEKEQPA